MLLLQQPAGFNSKPCPCPKLPLRGFSASLDRVRVEFTQGLSEIAYGW